MKETGQLLKKYREKSNLSIDTISESLKISARVLRAMEDDQTDRLPPRTFLRGFVQSYAQYVGADVEQVLECFRKEVDGGSEEAQTTPPPTKAEPPAPAVPTVDESKGSPVETKTKNQARAEKAQTKGAHKKNRAPKKARAVWAIDYRKWSLATKAFAIIVVAVLVGLIFFVTEMVEKYERESIVRVQEDLIAPPLAHDEEAILSSNSEDSVSEDMEETSAPTQEATESNATNVVAPEASAPVVAPDARTPVVAQPAEPTPSTPPAAAETATPTPKPALESAVEAPTPVNEPSATAEAPESAPQEADEEDISTAEESEPATSPVSAGTQEVIIEAFDQVEIQYVLDDEAPKKITLAPGDLHTLKADSRIKIQATNGGIVNIFHNGRDLGVPGRIGKPVNLSYP